MHAVDDYSSSDDESKEVMAAEIRWPAENKQVTCPSLKPIHKNRGEEVKFTFDVSKNNRIFDELLKIGYIKINYVLPSADELRKRAYCKYHNSYSHATNDCNVFRRQVQSALNEGRLSLTDMQLDKNPFLAHINVVEAKAPAVLIRPEQAATAQGKNVIIGDPRPLPNAPKGSGRQVLTGEDEEGNMKLTIVASSVQALRRQAWLDGRAARARPARPTSPVGQDGGAQATTKPVEPTTLVGSTGPE